MKIKGTVIGICIADAILLIVCAFLYLSQDRTAPVISFGENSIVYTEDMDTSLLLGGVTAMDDEDGDVSDTLLIEKISDTAKGDVIVTYAALDRSNNVAKASRIFPAKMNTGSQDDSQPAETETTDEDSSEAESETQTGSEDGEAPEEDGQQDGNDGQDQDDRNEAQEEDNRQDEQARRNEGQDNDNQNDQNEAGADMNPANEGGGNEAPVLRLSKDVLSVKAEAESVNWNDCIRSLSDDKDSKAQLFSNLVMEGRVDLGTPGEYPVTIWTKDSEGMESEKKNVVVRVE